MSLFGGDREWMGEAICASADPEAWFPPKGSSTREAKRVCRGGSGRPGCPVRAQCLEYALANDDRFGVWGGYSERERRTMKRRSV